MGSVFLGRHRTFRKNSHPPTQVGTQGFRLSSGSYFGTGACQPLGIVEFVTSRSSRCQARRTVLLCRATCTDCFSLLHSTLLKRERDRKREQENKVQEAFIKIACCHAHGWRGRRRRLPQRKPWPSAPWTALLTASRADSDSLVCSSMSSLPFFK